MRRTLLACGGLAGAWMSAGCIAVSAVETRFGPDSGLIVVNGRAYLVDKDAGSVCEVDLTDALACKDIVAPDQSD